jgi:hypothetical protein
MWFWSWETLATAARVSREVAIAILSDDMEALFIVRMAKNVEFKTHKVRPAA